MDSDTGGRTTALEPEFSVWVPAVPAVATLVATGRVPFRGGLVLAEIRPLPALPVSGRFSHLMHSAPWY